MDDQTKETTVIRFLLDKLGDAILWLTVDGALFAGLAGVLAFTYFTGANWQPWLRAAVVAALASLAAGWIVEARDARQHRATHDPDTCKEC